MMAARANLTDKQKKEIVARHAEGKSYRQIATEFNVCASTVMGVIKRSPDAVRMCTEKKEENTLDMFKYLDGQKGAVQKLLTNILNAMDDPAKLAKANVRDLATAYGIIIDKATQTAPKETEELLQRARDILGGIDGVIK